MFLTTALLQSDLFWEDAETNLKLFEKRLQSLGKTDLIILPEMFSTGFSMRTELAETMDGPSVRWMQAQAQRYAAVVTGSLMIREADGGVYNRLIWAAPDGSLQHYDKRHLFALGEESQHFKAGTDAPIFEYKGWHIAPFICYDLRFPVWSRNRAEQPYDLAIYVANWPQVRSEHWKALLRARAIENQAYVIGVNRVGTDGKGLAYSGDSSVFDPAGELLYQKSNEEDLATVLCSRPRLAEVREKWPFLKDQDAFSLSV